MQDCFDILTSEGVLLSSINTIMTWSETNLAQNGLAYVTRPIKHGATNSYTFKILKSTSMSIDIGIWKVTIITRQFKNTG